jgi:hypothetical protein
VEIAIKDLIDGAETDNWYALVRGKKGKDKSGGELRLKLRYRREK